MTPMTNFACFEWEMITGFKPPSMMFVFPHYYDDPDSSFPYIASPSGLVSDEAVSFPRRNNACIIAALYFLFFPLGYPPILRQKARQR